MRGWLHIWRLAESARQEALSPAITDDAVLARKFFQEAVALNPSEARYLGFLGASLPRSASTFAPIAAGDRRKRPRTAAARGTCALARRASRRKRRPA